MDNIVVALIGAGGSAIGAVLGIFINTKLINYRIEQLEEKVNKHNHLIERTYDIEARLDVQDEKLVTTHHRLENLEKRMPISVVSDNKYIRED